MRCRRITKGYLGHHIVWFGSYGKNDDGTAKFYDNEHSNFSSDAEAVADSIIQKLSVIKGELWFAINYGLPLLDEDKSKQSIDASIVEIVMSHKDVVDIIEFNSDVFNGKYEATLQVQTVYGVAEVVV